MIFDRPTSLRFSFWNQRHRWSSPWKWGRWCFFEFRTFYPRWKLCLSSRSARWLENHQQNFFLSWFLPFFLVKNLNSGLEGSVPLCIIVTDGDLEWSLIPASWATALTSCQNSKKSAVDRMGWTRYFCEGFLTINTYVALAVSKPAENQLHFVSKEMNDGAPLNSRYKEPFRIIFSLKRCSFKFFEILSCFRSGFDPLCCLKDAKNIHKRIALTCPSSRVAKLFYRSQAQLVYSKISHFQSKVKLPNLTSFTRSESQKTTRFTLWERVKKGIVINVKENPATENCFRWRRKIVLHSNCIKLMSQKES